MFIDLNVRKDEKITKRAFQLGYSGIVQVSKDLNHGKEFNRFIDSTNFSDLFISKGIEIKAKNPDELKKKVRKLRKHVDIILVHGGDVKVNRAAVENPHVDIICHPYRQRRDSGINHVLAKKAAENNVAVELNIKHLLRNRNHLRYQIMSHFRQLAKLKKKFQFPLVITSGAQSAYDVRSPLDLVALASCFGMDKKMAMEALSNTPQKIIVSTKEREDFIASGVRQIKE
jgi:ribonuclease P/MRP protein subunit RPP1